MKKNLLYLLALICTLNFFTACSDDDDDDKGTETWKELSKTYSGSSLALSGGSTVGAIAVNATSATAASVTLTNVVPDAKEVKIDATLAGTKGSYASENMDLSTTTYAISGKTADNTISINGTFDKDGKLSLNVTRTLNTVITGSFKLSYNQTLPSVYTDIATGDAATDAQLNTAIPMAIGGLMAGKVTAVTALLNADGSFDAEWTTVSGETNKLSTLVINDIIPIGTLLKPQYVVVDNILMIVVDKGIITTLGALIPSSVGIDMAQIVALMEDLGGYYGLPINFTQGEGGTTLFYLNKEQLAKILEIVAPFLEKVEDPQLATMLETVSQLLQAPTTTSFDFGLIFNKQ